jgi:WD40 repeat protein
MTFKTGKIFISHVLISLFMSTYVGGVSVLEDKQFELSPQIGTNKSELYPFEVQTMDFSPDGKTIAVGNSFGFTQLWSSQGYLLRVWHLGPQGGGVKFSNSGKVLVSYNVPLAEVYILNPEDGSLINKVELRSMLAAEESGQPSPWQGGQIERVDFSPDDSLLLLADRRYLVVWDLNRNSPRLTINSSQGEDNLLAAYFAASGSLIVANSGDEIKIWDLQGRLIRTLTVKGLTDFIVPGGGTEIICRAGDIVTIWNLEGVLQGKIEVGRGRRFSLGSLSRVAFLREENAILLNSAEGFHVWTKKGRLLREIPHKPREEMDRPAILRSSPDGKSFAVQTSAGEMSIWDSASGARKALVVKEISPVVDFALFPGDDIVTSSMKFLEKTGKLKGGLGFRAGQMTVSPDGRKIAILTGNREVILFDKAWDELRRFPVTLKTVHPAMQPVSFSPDSKSLAVPSETGIAIYDCGTGKVFSEIAVDPFEDMPPGRRAYIRELHFMPDGKTLLVGFYFGPMMLIDIAAKTRTFPQNLRRGGMGFGPPNAKLIIRGDGSFGMSDYDRIRFWSPTGSELPSIPIVTPTLWTDFPRLAYNANAKLLAIGGGNGEMEVIDAITGELVKELPRHFSPVTQVRFSPDGTHLLASSEDGILKIWNTQSWDSASILTTEDNEWLIYTPDGYFDASPHGGEMMAMVKGFNAYGIEQFAAFKNRPDLILERVKLGTLEQMSHYQDLYRRRLEKLGLTEALVHANPRVPEARIIKVEKRGKFAEVAFEISGAGYELKRLNVFVNNVPIFGPAGRKIQGERLSGVESIELGAGKNKIEVSALNSAGAESFRAVAYAEHAEHERGDIYYLGIGVSKYKDTSLNLAYADKDVKDLGSNILKMGGEYGEIFVKSLLNNEVTAENIKKAKNFLKNSRVDDTVVILIAGHGGYSKGAGPKYYYLPYGADPADIEKTGVGFDVIEGLLADIKPRKKLLLIDTCESGELEEAEFSRYLAKADMRGIKPRTFRKPANKRGVGAWASRSYLLEKDRFIHNDLARRTGAVVFSSSGGNEMSYESQAIMNGFFTEGIINALSSRAADRDQNGKISVDELKIYVRNFVSRDTGGLQNPTIDRDNLVQKIEFPMLAN